MPAKLQRDWAQIACDYMTGELPISELCARHQISRRTLCRQARAHGWTRPDADPAPPQTLIELRLMRAFALTLSQLEENIRPGKELTGAERERNAMTLARLVTAFGVFAKHAAKEVGAPHAEKNPAGERDEDMRAELAARLRNLIGSCREESAANAAEENGAVPGEGV